MAARGVGLVASARIGREGGWLKEGWEQRLAAVSLEVGVLLLGAVGQQVEAPHFHRDARVPGVGAEDTDAAALAELPALVVEVLGHADVAHHRPVLAGAQQGRWEDDGVEWHIVLAHELHHLDVLPQVKRQRRGED
eukprot:361415-Chlamydomonas_euryale.AAC.10